ncbi:MAG: cellulase family glycosylhydrolase, partial [Planctomycetota bacterium]|nr:cellulase family glycosylhydrolase [Planctomycetota bacterium]
MNVVRVPFSYSTLLNEDGTWRSDAFVRMDWLVCDAWQRGLYTILDFHVFLPPDADHNGSADGYYANDAQKAETVRIWKRIAAHYRGNPAIAMYDLLNEPNNSSPKGKPAPKAQVVCDLYDQIYQAIRSVDPDHLIAMEGMWDWKTLRNPTENGYTNVVYSFHWYNWGGKTTADRNKATDNDLQAVAAMQKAWHVPVFVGEFNLFGDKEAWKYAIEQYGQHKLNWTMWTFKNTASGSKSWGVYTTIPGKAPPVPNLVTDSADTIRQKWKAWATSPETFAINPMFKPLLTPAQSK